VQAQLAEIRKEYAALTPDQLKVIDPCSGSGHILAYMFDVLMQIYESYGYTTREAVASIVENNLYGLDIDDRAAQLAYFAVMMKARQYDRRFFSRGIQPHVYAIAESNHVDSFALEYFCNGDAKLKKAMDTIISELHDAKEYGSIITVSQQEWSALYDRFAEITEDINMSRETALRELLPLVQVAEALVQKYDAVVTNPPYMGASGMNERLSQYVKEHFPDTKADLFSCFIERGFKLANVQGFVSMITMESWMFLSSFEKMRQKIVNTHTIVNMVHMPYLGKGGTSLGINFGTAAVIFNKCYCRNYNSQFDYICYYETDENGVPFAFPTVNERYKAAKATDFSKIPGSPVAYWVSEAFSDIFGFSTVADYGFAGIGMRTGDNNLFLRLWYEISKNNMAIACHNKEEQVAVNKRWIPYNKGGDFRKWYGNNEYVVNWFNDGEEIKENTRKVYPSLGDNLGWKISNESFYYLPGVTWSGVTSSKNSFRAYGSGFIFDSGANGFFPTDTTKINVFTAYLNSCVSQYVLNIINPTINTGAGTVKKIPIILSDNPEIPPKIEQLADDNVSISITDWDSYETSWDFKRSPLV